MTNTTDIRFPSEAETPEQQEAFAETERLAKQMNGESFTLKDANGNFLGPFGVLSKNPTTFLPFLTYTQSFYRLPNLTPRERELGILAAAAVAKGGYVAYAHERIGVAIGLTKEQVERAGKGRVPLGVSEREQAIYELAIDIARDFGAMSEEQFESAVALLGKDGLAALTQLVGGYILICMLENVADVEVPQS